MKFISLTKNKLAIVDDQDMEILSKFKWVADVKGNTSYAITTSTKPYTYMHRMILGIKNKNIKVDHIDGNGLNNQRYNLRACTHSENIRNSKLSKSNKTGFKGVSFQKRSGKFMAYIRHNYKMYNLGLFETSKEAAIVRNKKALELHGRFAYINQV